MKVLGISRSPKYSPNSVDRDSAIFASVASKLQRKGYDVSIISEDLFIAVDLSDFDLVFSMARGHDVLTSLAEAESKNEVKVVNSALGLLHSTRYQLVEAFNKAGIPQPKTVVIKASDYKNGVGQYACSLKFPFWLKRGDECAQQVGDVCFLTNEEERDNAIRNFVIQGVEHIIAVEHAQGDLIKFYGVEGTDFFYYGYPTDGTGFSKFGLEQHNGRPSHTSFNENHFKSIADKAAEITGFTIYGGDAVVANDGSFQIIDFNDWPSFSSCRKAAAKAIVERLESK